MTLRRRGYLAEMSKVISVEKPERPSVDLATIKPGSLASWRRDRSRWRNQLKRAIEKALTWKDEKKGWVSQYSTVRLLRNETPIDDYILQIYDTDPDSKDKRNKIRFSVFSKRFRDATLAMSEHDDVRQARKAAMDWLSDRAVKFGATGVQRVAITGKLSQG